MSQHNAVLFVPEDLTKIAFWDLYATGMPIFVPDSKILSMLLCFEEKSLEKMHYFDNNARHPFVKTGHFEDLEPFNLKTHCARKLQLWAPLADYYQFPHVYLGLEHLSETGDIFRLEKIWKPSDDAWRSFGTSG